MNDATKQLFQIILDSAQVKTPFEVKDDKALEDEKRTLGRLNDFIELTHEAKTLDLPNLEIDFLEEKDQNVSFSMDKTIKVQSSIDYIIALRNQLDALRSLLKNFPALATQLIEDTAIFNIACSANSYQIVEYFIKELKFDVNEVTDYSYSEIKEEVVERTEHDPNRPYYQPKVVKEKVSTTVTQTLITSPLLTAAEKNYPHLVTLLLLHGANPELKVDYGTIEYRCHLDSRKKMESFQIIRTFKLITCARQEWTSQEHIDAAYTLGKACKLHSSFVFEWAAFQKAKAEKLTQEDNQFVNFLLETLRVFRFDKVLKEQYPKLISSVEKQSPVLDEKMVSSSLSSQSVTLFAAKTEAKEQMTSEAAQTCKI